MSVFRSRAVALFGLLLGTGVVLSGGCSSEHYAYKGDSCAASGNHAAAAAYYEKAVAKDPYDPALQQRLRRERIEAAAAAGDAALARHRPDEAEQQFHLLAQLAPEDPRAKAGLAQIPALRVQVADERAVRSREKYESERAELELADKRADVRHKQAQDLQGYMHAQAEVDAASRPVVVGAPGPIVRIGVPAAPAVEVDAPAGPVVEVGEPVVVGDGAVVAAAPADVRTERHVEHETRTRNLESSTVAVDTPGVHTEQHEEHEDGTRDLESSTVRTGGPMAREPAVEAAPVAEAPAAEPAPAAEAPAAEEPAPQPEVSIDCGRYLTMARLARLAGAKPEIIRAIDARADFLARTGQNAEHPSRWPSGNLAINSGENGPYYYPNDEMARDSGENGPWYYPSGEMARNSGEHGPWYYPSGEMARNSSENGPWYYPNGTEASKQDILEWASGVLGPDACQHAIDTVQSDNVFDHELSVIECAWRAQKRKPLR